MVEVSLKIDTDRDRARFQESDADLNRSDHATMMQSPTGTDEGPTTNRLAHRAVQQQSFSPLKDVLTETHYAIGEQLASALRRNAGEMRSPSVQEWT